MFQIILENTFRKINILEINSEFTVVLPTIVNMFETLGRTKLKKKTLVSKHIEKIDENKMNELDISLHPYDSLSEVAPEMTHNIVVSAICTSTKKEAQEHVRCLSSLVERKGFILLFHKSSVLPPENLLASLVGMKISLIPELELESWFREVGLTIISKVSHDIAGNLYLLRHKTETESDNIVHLSEDNPNWLEELKDSLVTKNKKTWVVSEDCASSGIVGMINCIRQEPNGENVRCVFISGKNKEKYGVPAFSFTDPFFNDVLEKDLIMNIYKDGCWGSIRTVEISTELPKKMVDHSYVAIKRLGDLSSFEWLESPISYEKVRECTTVPECEEFPEFEDIVDNELIHVYYSALNFRDVMLATGKLSLQVTKASDDCIIGLEVAGRISNGQRVTGIVTYKGMGTSTLVHRPALFRVPDNWSLEEAATVPTVYITAYYALIVRGNLQRGESILIHSGTGGVGQAAIRIAQSMDCEIFTTVGTDLKRKYILEKFPSIKEENIGCSRNTTFEDMIMERTSGKGVNVVLNSLAGEKFYASLRCVSVHGRFLEIGKYDLFLDHKIGLKMFLENITFHGVFLDVILSSYNSYELERTRRIMEEGVKNGVVQPLDRTVFERHEVEKAFRYMAAGTHIGKVIVKIRDEEKESCTIPKKICFPATPVTYFYPHKVYIIIGGLGGFGIEVTKWLFEKHAQNVVLTTRYGARTPYHHLCLKRWQEAGYNVIVSKRNVSIKEEAAKLLKEASAIGPVGGIFNSAIVLHDAFLENTDMDSFREVCAPKADATRYLDVLSRCLCPELDHFVCFSSISCGKGNAGQMNYGYANSVMERVCEERQADGYPGVAIQYGIIGDVGVVHRHVGDDAMVAGVVAQRVKSCLQILDKACQLKKPVVTSFVHKDSSSKAGDQGDILQHFARMFGFKDASEFNPHRSFGEMGLDSMIGVEVKHLLESTCDIDVSLKDIQNMKIGDLKDLIEKSEQEKKKDLSTALVTTKVKLPKRALCSETAIHLNDVSIGVPVFIFDIECVDISNLKKLAEMINLPVYGFVWPQEIKASNVNSLSSWYFENIKKLTRKTAHLVPFSSASVVALDIMIQNEKSGSLSLSLTTIHGYPYLLKVVSNDTKTTEVDILYDFVENYAPSARMRLKEQLSKTASIEQQVTSVVDFFSRCSAEVVNKSELTQTITEGVNKLKMLEEYEVPQKLSKDLVIIEDSANLLANDIAEAKIVLSQICFGKITVQRVPDINITNDDSIPRLASSLKSVLDSSVL